MAPRSNASPNVTSRNFASSASLTMEGPTPKGRAGSNNFQAAWLKEMDSRKLTVGGHCKVELYLDWRCHCKFARSHWTGLNLGASKREHAHVRTEERERERDKRRRGKAQRPVCRGSLSIRLMESDALQSGGAGAQPPQKKIGTTMSLRQVHDEFGVGQNTQVMRFPNSKMKIEALPPTPNPRPFQWLS